MKASKYNFGEIEKKWQKQWLAERTYEPDLDSPKKPFYNLMMFPYPSAEGLHVGNMYAFTGSDIYGRMKRMQGHDVFEPIGLDGFGIHSENYALKIKAHPMKQAQVSETRFYEQLGAIGNGFAWDERLETYDPEYYRWTQWIFIQLWKHGLAYRKKQAVNWCPSCKTVLADEQVVAGKCERCGATVEVRELEQWFFRITKYADRLLNNLEKIDWSERVKIAQRNWIGRSEGAEIVFKLLGISGQPDGKHELKVFTTRPDTLLGATFMVVSPELAKQWMEVGRSSSMRWKAPKEVVKYVKDALVRRVKKEEGETEKTGVPAGIFAVNPANQEKIPVWVSDYVLSGYGTGAIMAVPAHDERDMEFAKNFDLPVSNAPLVDKREIVTKVGGEFKTQYRLRDWLISRQRYWGVPIPMIHCEACAAAGKGEQKEMPGWYAVPEEELPVELPYVEDFRPQGKGESPLASAPEFYKAECPGCGGDARRETDVSDTFLDSAWYYLRYPSTRSARSGQVPWDPAITKKWFPVNLYTGGAEHSVLHLLYVRFIAMAFHDLGFLPFEEPFPKFRAHGLLISEGTKMSKSKGNVVNPDEYIGKYGADALRMYLMFLAPFEQGGDFRDEGIRGMVRFLERVWRLFQHQPVGERELLTRLFHKTTKKVTEDIEGLQYNTAISALMVLVNEMESSGASSKMREGFIKLLAPFAPHLAEELWHQMEHSDSIHRAPWPTYDEALIQESTFPLVVQVNGRYRATIPAPRGIVKEKAEALAREDIKIGALLEGKKVKKVIYVKDRLINFVAE
ncbi:MAG: class I tRNA ligase family protein [Candidatus Jorgensenbacteria bacterium]|nr:class I tRNA ligase family protein [Candidatus Jorgensenbacteria bacterium]